MKYFCDNPHCHLHSLEVHQDIAHKKMTVGSCDVYIEFWLCEYCLSALEFLDQKREEAYKKRFKKSREEYEKIIAFNEELKKRANTRIY